MNEWINNKLNEWNDVIWYDMGLLYWHRCCNTMPAIKNKDIYFVPIWREANDAWFLCLIHSNWARVAHRVQEKIRCPNRFLNFTTMSGLKQLPYGKGTASLVLMWRFWHSKLNGSARNTSEITNFKRISRSIEKKSSNAKCNLAVLYATVAVCRTNHCLCSLSISFQVSIWRERCKPNSKLKCCKFFKWAIGWSCDGKVKKTDNVETPLSRT